MTHFQAKRIAVMAALITMTTTAFAQYIWLDEKGVKQYSDIPPGPSVPLNRILKEPAARPAQPATSNPAPAPTADRPEGTAAKAPMTIAEKNADFIKRKLEREEKEKKDAAQAKAAEDKARDCERARVYSRSLTNGERIVGTDKDGNRSYLTDEQRVKETSDINNFLNKCK